MKTILPIILFLTIISLINPIKLNKKNDKPIIRITGAVYPSNCVQVGIWPLFYNLSYVIEGNYTGPIDEFEMLFVDMITETIYSYCKGDTSLPLINCTSMGEIAMGGEYIPMIDGDIETENYIIKDFILFNSTVGISIYNPYVRPVLYNQTVPYELSMYDSASDNVILEFEEELDDYSVPSLVIGRFDTLPCTYRKKLLYCPVPKDLFPPREEPYTEVSLLNVCNMKDLALNLTVKGTPLVRVEGVHFHEQCSNLRKGTRFEFDFNTTAPIPDTITTISQIELYRYGTKIRALCVISSKGFNCTTNEDAVKEGPYEARLEDDEVAHGFSIMYFNLSEPVIKYSENYTKPKNTSQIKILIDYKNETKKTFKVEFMEEIKALPQVVIANDTQEIELECEKDKAIMSCLINGESFPTQKDAPGEFKTYNGYLKNTCEIKEIAIQLAVVNTTKLME